MLLKFVLDNLLIQHIKYEASKTPLYWSQHLLLTPKKPFFEGNFFLLKRCYFRYRNNVSLTENVKKYIRFGYFKPEVVWNGSKTIYQLMTDVQFDMLHFLSIRTK